MIDICQGLSQTIITSSTNIYGGILAEYILQPDI